MSYFDKLLERRTTVENPATPITWQNLINILGGTQAVSGKTVNPSTAMQLTTVFACVSLLSETFASLPALLYRRLNPGRERAIDHPLYTVLHDIANPEQTSADFRSMQMAHLLLWGNCYAEVVRNGAGFVKQLWPIPSNRVTAKRNARNELVYQISLTNNDLRTLSASRVLHVSGLLGLSPISQAREALGLTMAAEEYGGRFFSNNSVPGGLIEHPGNLSPEAQIRLRDQVEEQTRGLSNQHRLMLLEEGMKWQQTGLSAEDSQFLETRKFQVAEIARIFRVPPFMVGDVEKSTSWGTGIEQQGLGFVIYSLRSWLVRWEQECDKTLLTEDERKNYFIEFLVDGLLRGDYKTRQEGLAIQRQNGVINADEWRELENMNEIPDKKGKIYMTNAAMVPLGQVGAQTAAPAPAEPDDNKNQEEEDNA